MHFLILTRPVTQLTKQARAAMAASVSCLPISPDARHSLLEFLINAAQVFTSTAHQLFDKNASPNSPIQNKQQLSVRPIIKYTALFFFAGAFLPSLRLNSPLHTHWLLRPLRESNLQLFALVAIWVANKIHDSRPLSVKSFKSLGDMLITDQHFTTRDFAEGEMIFLEVLRFEIGASNIAFVYLEDLHIQLRELSKLGELVSFDVCMDIMDLLYETEETSVLFDSPCSLAASIIVTAYIVSVRKQQWEFPILPWVKFVTSYEEEEIMGIVRKILQHILKPFMQI